MKSFRSVPIPPWLSLAVLAAALPSFASGAESVTLTSPDDSTVAVIAIQNQQLVYRITHKGQTMLSDARLGVTVDGSDLGSGVKDLNESKVSSHKETYRINGDDSQLTSHDQRVTITALRDGEPLIIELRAFNDGVGFRYIIPGSGPRKITGEATSWSLPAQSKLWFRTNEHGDYSGKAEQTTIGAMPKDKEIVGPLIAELPNSAGFVGITESDPWKYSGLSFKIQSADLLGAQFRFDPEWTVQGGQPTAWRVAMLGNDLNSLMHGRQIVTHLAPAHDPKLYPKGADTAWIKPGRSAWSWLDPNARARGGVTVEHQKRFIDMASELGFEYNTVDDGWEMWPDKWKTLSELVDYAKSKNVRLIAWKDTADGDRVPDPTNNYENLRKFLDHCRDAGLAGIKIDFLWGNPLIGEGSKTLSFMPVVYQMCAERQLLVNFHGAVKPTGQARTWPNAITQEPILGLEAAADSADAVITAFICGLSGYCDYTPGSFGTGESPEIRGKTSWSHQLALGITFCSPMLHWASGPELTAAAFPQGSIERAVYQSIPSHWDETIVLDVSKVGSIAGFARRNGKDWYVGIINGSKDQPLALEKISLPFLAKRKFQCITIADGEKPDHFVTHKSTGVTADTPLSAKLLPGGGFVAVLRPE